MKPNTKPQQNRLASGLTLIELMLVLVVLAAVSLIALESTTGIVDQSRFDTSVKTLENTGNAIVRSDEAGQIFGYLPDIGALPESLDELLERPAGILEFGLHDVDVNGDGTPEFQLSSGWRGPYLRLPVGVSQVQDSWGTEIDTNLDDVGFDPSVDDVELRSFGSDLLLGDGDGQYQQDLEVVLSPQMRQGSVSYALDVKDRNTTINGPVSSQLKLRLFRYRPDATVADGYQRDTLSASMVTTNGADHNFNIDAQSLAPGLQYLVVVKWYDSVVNDNVDSSEAIQAEVVPYLLKPQTTLNLNRTVEVSD